MTRGMTRSMTRGMTRSMTRSMTRIVMSFVSEKNMHCLTVGISPKMHSYVRGAVGLRVRLPWWRSCISAAARYYTSCAVG